MITREKIKQYFTELKEKEIAGIQKAISRSRTEEQINRRKNRVEVFTAAIEASETVDCDKVPDNCLNGNMRLDSVLKYVGVDSETINKLFS
jgi:hypothetical protein